MQITARLPKAPVSPIISDLLGLGNTLLLQRGQPFNVVSSLGSSSPATAQRCQKALLAECEEAALSCAHPARALSAGTRQGQGWALCAGCSGVCSAGASRQL